MSTRTFSVAPRPRRREERLSFACFGGECTVIVADAGCPSDAAAAADQARRSLLDWHRRFSRFQPDSELGRLNRDPRGTVPASALMLRLVDAALRAATVTGGLVDPTLADEIERSGYTTDLAPPAGPAATMLAGAPARCPAAAAPNPRWREVEIDPAAGTVTRPPGVALDLGGIAKGVFADELSAGLQRFDAFAVDCAGDLRVGGRAGLARPVRVTAPFDDRVLHWFRVTAGAVATSGIGRRRWTGPDGGPRHHLLDPRSGRPAFTGVAQATALAPTAAEAEALAKAALLSGPRDGARWLRHGGLLVTDDGSETLIAPPAPAAGATTGTTPFRRRS